MKDSKKFIEYFFVIALFCFGLCYYCFHILGFDLSQTPGDYGDSRFINYILEHGFKWLKGQDPDFWRANFMYPLKDNVAISDSMAGALPVYALFRFMGIGVETSYQLWWLSTCILNFWFCFIAFKKIGFNGYLSAIGAYVFAFGINNFNQFYHLQFNYKFFIPVCIAAVYLFLKNPKNKYVIVFVLSIVLQFYASAYLGILLIYFSMALIALYLFYRNNRKLFFGLLTKKIILQGCATVVAGLLLILVVAIPYYSMTKYTGYREYDGEVQPYLPGIYSYFFPSATSLTWHFLDDSPVKQLYPSWYLHDLFPGLFCYLGLLICVIYIIKQRVQKRNIESLPVILFSICLIFILLISRTQSGFSLFAYFRQLPGFLSMRLTMRFMIVIVFFMIWLSLYFINTISKKGLAVYLLFALVIVTDNLFIADRSVLSFTPKKIREERVAAMCDRIIKNNVDHKKIIACIHTKKDSEVFMQLDVMLACQRLNLKTLNGYSSTCVAGLCNVYSDTAHVELSEWLRKYYIPEKDVLFITDGSE